MTCSSQVHEVTQTTNFLRETFAAFRGENRSPLVPKASVGENMVCLVSTHRSTCMFCQLGGGQTDSVAQEPTITTPLIPTSTCRAMVEQPPSSTHRAAIEQLSSNRRAIIEQLLDSCSTAA